MEALRRLNQVSTSRRAVRRAEPAAAVRAIAAGGPTESELPALGSGFGGWSGCWGRERAHGEVSTPDCEPRLSISQERCGELSLDLTGLFA